ncbi:hypothetical protein PoB_003464500 [Plakobranchus ocellatus]|uniref:Uncharacterized protein n=1 Tax=Plakobranchus ocellatus TaxID=259542 RepID=A0AAV4AIZ9_9GAST|nr:hypothetical protein PoB_003464500 [Plakobranchus ocellatus]
MNLNNDGSQNCKNRASKSYRFMTMENYFSSFLSCTEAFPEKSEQTHAYKPFSDIILDSTSWPKEGGGRGRDSDTVACESALRSAGSRVRAPPLGSGLTEGLRA